MPEGQTERVTAPANFTFRAPRDRFKRKSIRKTSKNTTLPKNKTLYFRGFHKGEAQAPPCAGFSRTESLNRLFIQYFWRSKNIGGVQGEKSCRRNENVFALSLSHHLNSQLFIQHFCQAKILAGCRARSPAKETRMSSLTNLCHCNIKCFIRACSLASLII